MDKLIADTAEGFRGKYYFLSNMYPIQLEYEGYIFPSSENLYQWLKYKDCDILSLNLLIAKDGKQAKRLTKNKFIDISDATKLEYMQLVLDLKFENEDLKNMLIDTGEIELVEYNWWGDVFWGVYKGKGRNILGNMLMRKREELKNE